MPLTASSHEAQLPLVGALPGVLLRQRCEYPPRFKIEASASRASRPADGEASTSARSSKTPQSGDATPPPGNRCTPRNPPSIFLRRISSAGIGLGAGGAAVRLHCAHVSAWVLPHMPHAAGCRCRCRHLRANRAHPVLTYARPSRMPGALCMHCSTVGQPMRSGCGCGPSRRGEKVCDGVAAMQAVQCKVPQALRPCTLHLCPCHPATCLCAVFLPCLQSPPLVEQAPPLACDTH
jgi:hypothetical protein